MSFLFQLNLQIAIYSWNFFPISVHTHWILQNYTISNNEAVSGQKPSIVEIVKTYTAKG